jgi:glycosyltransferase involved in cell wall biosynthesis
MTMNICVVARLAVSQVHGIGGAQSHVLTLCKGLARAGCHVSLITSEHPDKSCETIDGVNIYYVPRANVKLYYPIEWEQGSRQIFGQLCDRTRFDILHLLGGSGLSILSASLDAAYNIPTVTTFLGTTWGNLRGRLRAVTHTWEPKDFVAAIKNTFVRTYQHYLKYKLHQVYRNRHVIVSSHSHAADAMQCFHLRRDLVHVIPHGIDLRIFKPYPKAHIVELRQQYGLHSTDKVLLAVGRVIVEKGFQVAVAACQRLLREHRSLRLLIVGDGPYLSRLKAKTESAGLQQRVMFIGGVEEAQTANFYNMCDVFLFPTCYEESFGLVAVEAMACGKPVVASRLGGIPEVLGAEEQSAGILIEPGNVADLAIQVDLLLKDPVRRREIGEAARRRAEEQFSLPRMIEDTLALYGAIIESHQLQAQRLTL